MSVPFYKPALPPYELVEEDFRKAYLSGILAPGIYTDRLKRALEEHLNVKHAVLFSNCSDGLMCLIAYIKSLTGKTEVIIPSFTFAATWQAVDWNGMTSVICDVDDNGLLNPEEVEKYLKESPNNVAAILAVHTFGQPAYVQELGELALRYKTLLICDAAHGMGSLLNDKPLGTTFAEVFSIGTTKTLAAGEGGFIATNDNQLAEAMYRASMHGHQYGSLDVELKSLNGRIQEVNSIIGYHALNKLEETVQERQRLANNYIADLEEISLFRTTACSLKPIITRSFTRSSYKDFSCIMQHTQDCQKKDCRDRLYSFLLTRGIHTKKYYYPSINNLDVLNRPNDCGGKVVVHSSKVGERLARDCLSLPFFNGMTTEQISKVADALYEWARMF